MSIVGDNNESEINEAEFKKIHNDLSLSLKERLDELDMEKLSILANFYSQLILSIYMLFFLNSYYSNLHKIFALMYRQFYFNNQYGIIFFISIIDIKHSRRQKSSNNT
jgi:hypothetical protein